MEEKSKTCQINELIFPMVYGKGSKDNDIAKEVFTQIIKYSKSSDCLFKEKERKNIYQQLTKVSNKSKEGRKSLEVKFKCEYGCAIIFTKQIEESPINVQIICPEEWASGANDWRAKKLDFCQPKSQTSIYTTVTTLYSQELQNFIPKFELALQRAVGQIRLRCDSEQHPLPSKYSPEEIEQACKIALQNGFREYNIYGHKSEEMKAANEEQEKDAKSAIKNGAGLQLSQSEADTAWYVTKAVVLRLIGTERNQKEIGQKFIIGFRGNILEQATEQKAKLEEYNQKQVQQFKNCLDQLIFEYKHRISKSSKKVEKFIEMISRIQKNLVKIKGGYLTSRIENRKNFYKEIDVSVKQKPTMIYPQEIKHKEEEIILIKIGQFPMKVDARFPFQGLLDIYHTIDKSDQLSINKWILLTEKTVFALTEQLCNNKEVIDLKIHMREIQCEIGASTMCELIEIYEKEINKQKQKKLSYYGMLLQGQALSHIHLIRAICSVVSFESVKLHRQLKESNLKTYRVPIDIDKLFKQFISNSYQARKAMKQLNTYSQFRKERKKIFVLIEQDTSYFQFAQKVAKETRSAHVWVQSMKMLLETEKQLKVTQIQLEQSQQRLNQSIRYENLNSCKPSRFKNQVYNIKYESPTQRHPQNPWVYAFLNTIPSDVLGMMKILLLAQIPKKPQKKVNQDNNIMFINGLFAHEKLPIKIYASKQAGSQTISSHNISKKEINVLYPQNSPNLLVQDCQQAQGYKDNLFYREISGYEYAKNEKDVLQIQSSQLTMFMHSPNDTNCQREHLLYANQHLKPSKMELQNFLGIANVRSAEHTELMVLCSNLLERRITSNSYDLECMFAERVILQVGGRLSSYNVNTELHFGKIRKLLKLFIKNWIFSDINFCPIIAPFLGVMAREIIYDKIASQEEKEQLKTMNLQISKKCLEQFKRGENELRQKPQLKIQWDQRYISMAAICCFREVELEDEDAEQIQFLAELIFQLRSSKILSDREVKPENKREFETELQFCVEKAIYRNIEVLSNYLHKNDNSLTKIVKKMDNGVPEDIKWTRQNLFAFKGESAEARDIYQLDLYKGCIYKNGKEISALDEKIKSSRYYQEIFGKDRQFQVFPSHNPFFVRTKDNVNYQFKIKEQRGQIFFQFSEDGKQIRHVITKKLDQGKNQQIWTLIPRQKLQQSNCYIPKLYYDNYLAWFSMQRRCIIFRRPKYEHIYQIGMAIYLDFTNPYPTIRQAELITYHGTFQDQNLDEICDIKNQKYQQMILRKKDNKLNEVIPFGVLQRFESPEYILQLKNKKTKIIYYLLHRYQLRFRLHQDKRLQSESYFGYALDYSFYNDKDCLFNKFPCLVLEKDSDNPSIFNNHQRIIIVSEGIIQYGGKINKDWHADIHISSYKYDIHDFFGDIRGSNRIALLHLSSIMLSINDNMKIESIEMTPLQYCMYLIKACITNRPLSRQQYDKIRNIINIAPIQLMLLCQALWRISNELLDVLPFQEKNYNPFYYLQQQLLTCRTLYQNRYRQNTIRFRESINKDILKFINIHLHAKKQKQQNNPEGHPSSSSDQFDQDFSFWKGLQVFTGQNIIEQISKVQEEFQTFKQKTKALNIWDKKADIVEQKFPQQISQLKRDHPNDDMMIQMVDELKLSYQVFISQQIRIQKIAQTIQDERRQQQKRLVTNLKKDAEQMVFSIGKIIGRVKQQNSKHPDIITGIRPTLSESMYTSILCQMNVLQNYYPNLSKKAEKQLKIAMKIWLQLKTRISSFERIQNILDQKKVDVVALMRQVLSPREIVFKKPQWLCFEAEMKVQLWPSQLETYNNLIDAKSGAFCQLNMGEGKTQVIIPLMILNTIYSKDLNCLPRINLLSSLFEQARGNFFRFISATGFQIPGFEIPFNRSVALNKHKISAVRNLIDSFSNKVYILMSRESRLSEVLRFHQIGIHNKNLRWGQFPIIKNQIFDIFDEIDAMMNCKKSYIFSIGKQIELSDCFMRLEILRVCLEVFLKYFMQDALARKLAITDQTDQDALELVRRGQYPAGLRLTLDNASPKDIMDLRKAIARKIVCELDRHEYSFIRCIKEVEINRLIEYIIDPSVINTNICKDISQASRPQIFLLRGALAYGIFEHCLSLRCGVDYGAPNHFHIKKIAVPYEAADIPSKTSEYEQPDVSGLLSYMSYYTIGLNQQQFVNCLEALLQLSNTSKSEQYRQWVQSLREDVAESLQIKLAQQINYNSKAHRQLLFNTYKKNRVAIAFWLNKCIFPKDLKQFQKSICSSSWDLADVQQCVGFSGTKDNHWLYSDKLHWKPCETPAIKGTDGKMVHLITKHTRQVCLIEQNDKTLWQRFVDLALKKEVGCIIDAGALCVGKSLKDQIVPWIADHRLFNKQKYIGISFCDNNGRWQVYDIEGKYYIPRGTTIPDHQTFVIFDQARTRGADLKMDGEVIAALSLGPDITKDSFMQAAGRLRKLGRNQSLVIMATQEVYSYLPKFPKQAKLIEELLNKKNAENKQQLPKIIISWVCINSVKQNHDLLMQFASLGWKFIHSKVKNSAFQQEMTTELNAMYERPLEYNTISVLNRNNLKVKDAQIVDHKTAKFICKILDKYGRNVKKQGGTLDDVCEREVEAEKQKEKEQQNGLFQLTPIMEKQKPQIIKKIKDIPFVFDKAFTMTENFINTTKSKIMTTSICNEIPQVYFLRVSDTEITAISIREASKHIYKHIINREAADFKIRMLNDLSIEDEFIVEKKLEGALVSAKFLSGIENFTLKEEDHLLRFFIQSSKEKKKEWSENYSELVSLFLKLKRFYLKKFKGSTLEKLITRLHNEGGVKDQIKEEMRSR